MRYPYKPTYKIAVSGAAAGDTLTASTKRKARALGRAIAKAKAVLTTGATTGLPTEASRGAKEAGGVVFGFSPATTKSEHVRKYKLPINNMDVVVFTGNGYAGRNLILTRSSDAVIVIGGRIGTLNEFTIAYEDKKVIGVLEDSGGMSDELREILDIGKRGRRHVVFDTDPNQLVKKVILELGKAEKHNHQSQNDE